MTEPRHYPVFLDLTQRRCVVVGDSPLAEEKVDGLRAAGADVTHHRRLFATGDLAGAYLAVEASGVPASQAAARAEADQHGVLLNVVDAARHCDWIAPAVVRRGALQVAISTGGESPFLAARLRERLEVMLGEEWAPFTSLVGRVRRRLRRRGVSTGEQQHAYRRLLRSNALTLLAGGRRDAAEAVAASIERDVATTGDPAPAGGEVVLVGAGPGDAGLLTVAGRDALANADVIVHDSLVSDSVLRLRRPGCRLVDAGKRAGLPSTAQEEINATLIDNARQGHFVVRLKGGDPYLFGRGGEEVAALRAAGVPVRVVPGVSSALAAPAAAGIPVTHRGVAASVGIVTAQRAGGPVEGLEGLARAVDTLVVLMPGDIAALTARLVAVLGRERPAALVASATTEHQQVVRAPLGEIAEAARRAALSGPLTFVCGDSVDAIAAPGSRVEPLAVAAFPG